VEGSQLKSIIIAMLIGSVSSACTSQQVFQPYCAGASACEGGNDQETAACVVSLEGEERKAAIYDCSNQFARLVACARQNGVCNNNNFEVASDSSGDSMCLIESRQLRDCENLAKSSDDQR
jgi:hypothetical protein